MVVMVFGLGSAELVTSNANLDLRVKNYVVHLNGSKMF
jgi:hypothetical protein